MARLEPITAPRSFVTLVANTRSGVPDAGINPEMLRTTHTSQNITIGGRTNRQGLIQGTPVAPNVGVLTIADNDFSVAAEIILGDYILVSNLDYIPGALVGNTATNITAAINRLTDFEATVKAAVVTINYVRRLARVPFLVQHYGAVTNFTVTPTTGRMTEGDPAIGPPALT